MKVYILGLIVIAAVAAWAARLTFPALAAASEYPAASTAIDQPVAKQFSGNISSIDEAGSTLIVRGAQASQTFKVAMNAVVVTKDKPQGKLGDLKIGDKVDVVYQRVEGDTTFTATRIEVIGE